MAVLLGPDGEPINHAKLTEEEATPTLSGIRSVLGEHPSVGLTPVRLARILREAEEGDASSYLELAEEMEEKDLHYLSVLGTRKRAVSQLDIKVYPASDSKEDEANAQLVRDFLSRDGLEDELFDILDAINKGFSLTEIVWETSEKQWMPKKLEWVDPRWVEFDQLDRKTMRLKADGGAVPLTPYKYITCNIKAKSGLPLRGGIARAAAWTYIFKNFGVKAWVTFCEVFGQPIRVGKYHAGASDKDKKTLLRAVANIGSDAAAVIPQNMMIEFIAAANANGGGDTYKKLADFCDQQVSKAVLGQTTTTDAISGGHAVSKEHNDVRGDIQNADAKALAGVLKRDLVIPLIDLNRGKQKKYPNIIIGDDDKVDSVKLANTLKNLVPLGLKVSASDIRNKIGLKAPENDEDILTFTESVKPIEATQTAIHKKETEFTPIDPDEIDLMVSELLENDAEEIEKDFLNPIEKLAQDCQSYNEFQEKLPDVLAKIDTSKLESSLKKGSFAAEVSGIVGYEDEINND